MHIKTFAALASAMIAGVRAGGTAYVYNYCDFPVNVWPVDLLRNPKTATVIQPGESYSESYHTLSSGGVSLKLGTTPTLQQGKVTQFEYTLIGGFIWYDGSNVDCRDDNCPFKQWGAYVEASDPSCPIRKCDPGENRCAGFYVEFNDDINTLACAPNTDVKMYLCTNTGKKTAAAAASPAAIAAPAASSPAKDDATPSAPVKVVANEAVHAPTTLRRVAHTARAVHIHAKRHGH